MSWETLAPALLVLVLNVIGGTIITTLIKREISRNDEGFRGVADMRQDVARIGARFDGFKSDIERLQESVESLQPLSISMEVLEKRVRCLTKKLDEVQGSLSVARRRINLLRAHAIPRIDDVTWDVEGENQ